MFSYSLEVCVASEYIKDKKINLFYRVVTSTRKAMRESNTCYDWKEKEI